MKIVAMAVWVALMAQAGGCGGSTLIPDGDTLPDGDLPDGDPEGDGDGENAGDGDPDLEADPEGEEPAEVDREEGGEAEIADTDPADADDETDGDTANCQVPQPSEPGEVATEAALVRGFQTGGVWAFLGIPYAAPPLGARRWLPPGPPPCQPEPLVADTWPEACFQKDFQLGVPADQAEIVGSEDCLHLNLWTQGFDDRARAVLVFIHGGGNVSGSTGQHSLGQRIFDGALLADRGDVVVVTIQYRLGPFGFLVLPELAGRDPRGVSGNYGLLDQQAALGWVQRNIALFGGDPDRVLLFGESAGAVDTCMQLASPSAAGLFATALMQSGGCGAGTLEKRTGEGRAFLTEIGCSGADPLACLLAAAPEVLVAPLEHPFRGGFAGGGGFGPVIDGALLPVEPLEAIGRGLHNRVPFVVGANADETSKSVPAAVTPAMVRALFSIVPQPWRDGLLALYPPGTTDEEARAAYVAATTDAQFVCPSRTIARTVAAGQEEQVFRYFFSHTAPEQYGGAYGAFHGLELAYLFQVTERLLGGVIATPDDLFVQRMLLGWWTQFARFDAPVTATLPPWPSYDPALDTYMELSADPAMGSGLRTEKCDLWDEVGRLAGR